MNNVDPVILKLEADLADYQRDLSKAQRLTDTKLDAIERKGAVMGERLKAGFSVAKTAAVGFVAGIAVDKITQAISAGLEYASSLGEVAQQLGVSTKALQEYRFAASQAGLSQDEMDQALSQLTRRIGEAQSGTKAQAEAFEKLGISIKTANGVVLDAGEAIPLIAEALRGVQSPAERAAILMDLFGKSGQKLEPLLAGGAAGVNALRDAAHRLGIVLSEEQIQKADDTADKLSALRQVLEAKVAGAVSDNADSILYLANALTELIEKTGAAVRAWQNWRKEQANRLDQNTVDGWFSSDADKAAAQARINARNSSTRVVVAGGGPVKPTGKRPTSGFGAPLALDPNKLGTNWGAIGVSGKYQRANLAGEGLDTGASPLGFGAGGVKGGLDAIGGASKAVDAMTAQLMALTADLAIAQADLTGDLRARADAEKQRIDADLASGKERLTLDETMTAAQRDQIGTLLEQQASARKQLVEQRLAEDLARKANEARAEAVTFELDALDAERDAALTRSERVAIEQRILEIQQEEERARLEAAIAAGQIADATKARASLSRRQGAERTTLGRDQQGPGARYLDGLRKDAGELNDAYQAVAVDGLKSLNDGLVEAIMGSKSLGAVFKNVANQIVADLLRIAIQRALIQPLAEGLFGGSSGGGLLGSLFGGLFGRASGGYVAPGQMVRVNEGASPGRVEAFMSRDGGSIIPLGRMNAAQGGGSAPGGVVRIVIQESASFLSTIQTEAAGVAVEVVKQSAPALIDASARETMARAGRPRI